MGRVQERGILNFSPPPFFNSSSAPPSPPLLPPLMTGRPTELSSSRSSTLVLPNREKGGGFFCEQDVCGEMAGGIVGGIPECLLPTEVFFFFVSSSPLSSPFPSPFLDVWWVHALSPLPTFFLPCCNLKKTPYLCNYLPLLPINLSSPPPPPAHSELFVLPHSSSLSLAERALPKRRLNFNGLWAFSPSVRKVCTLSSLPPPPLTQRADLVGPPNDLFKQATELRKRRGKALAHSQGHCE